jgi:protein tyrosine/serine phosphatase
MKTFLLGFILAFVLVVSFFVTRFSHVRPVKPQVLDAQLQARISQASQVIPNFRVVSPSVFRGGNPVMNNQNGLAVLAAANVAIDIDLQGGDIQGLRHPSSWFTYFIDPGDRVYMRHKEKEVAEKNGIKFINLPLDSRFPVTCEEDEKINQVLDIMKKATPEKSVFVHCQHGKDRTGLVIALYQVLYQGKNQAEAYHEWESMGHTNISKILTGSLDDYFFARTSHNKSALKKYFKNNGENCSTSHSGSIPKIDL